MIRSSTLFLILFLSFSSLLLKAQSQFSGSVTDTKSGLPLKGVQINVRDMNTLAYSDSLGHYTIKNIPAGTYLVDVSFKGYATKIENILVKGAIRRDFVLEMSPLQLKEVVVTGVATATDKQKTPMDITTVSAGNLLENSSTNVIDAIAKTPGVSAITDGQSISKPVIRGLGYNRVLTVNDGVQQVDQAWFDEFGIEADPDAVNRYEILKGPGSLAYGSDAIAGVINLIPEEPLADGQIRGEVLFNYQTNNGLMNNLACTVNGAIPSYMPAILT
jgi:iron complex outermembrane receptor protein